MGNSRAGGRKGPPPRPSCTARRDQGRTLPDDARCRHYRSRTGPANGDRVARRAQAFRHQSYVSARPACGRFCGARPATRSNERSGMSGPMTFALTAEQLEIREAVARLCERFGDDYWLKKDTEGGFPHEFHRAMAEAGWLGVAVAEENGGRG